MQADPTDPDRTERVDPAIGADRSNRLRRSGKSRHYFRTLRHTTHLLPTAIPTMLVPCRPRPEPYRPPMSADKTCPIQSVEHRLFSKVPEQAANAHHGAHSEAGRESLPVGFAG